MKVYLYQLALYFLSGIFINAFGQTSVFPTISKVEIVAGKSGYIFNLASNLERELTGITVKWNEVENTYVEKDFGKLDNVHLRGVDVTTSITDGRAYGPLDYVVITIPYNLREVKDGDESWKVIDIIRLQFSKGKLISWDKAENDPNKPMNWKLSQWGSEIGFRDNGEDESKNNPYSVVKIGEENLF